MHLATTRPSGISSPIHQSAPGATEVIRLYDQVLAHGVVAGRTAVLEDTAATFGQGCRHGQLGGHDGPFMSPLRTAAETAPQIRPAHADTDLTENLVTRGKIIATISTHN